MGIPDWLSDLIHYPGAAAVGAAGAIGAILAWIGKDTIQGAINKIVVEPWLARRGKLHFQAIHFSIAKEHGYSEIVDKELKTIRLHPAIRLTLYLFNSAEKSRTIYHPLLRFHPRKPHEAEGNATWPGAGPWEYRLLSPEHDHMPPTIMPPGELVKLECLIRPSFAYTTGDYLGGMMPPDTTITPFLASSRRIELEYMDGLTNQKNSTDLLDLNSAAGEVTLGNFIVEVGHWGLDERAKHWKSKEDEKRQLDELKRHYKEATGDEWPSLPTD